MPELPDLEIIKEVLGRRITGLSIEEARVLRPLIVRVLAGDDFETRLPTQQIVGVTRRGKNLLLQLGGGDCLVINPMLAGRLRLCPKGTRPPRSAAVVLHLSDGTRLCYTDPKKMGKVYLTDDLDLVPRFSAQGPEALDPQLTLDAFLERLRVRRGEIKGVLTNQAVVAGIGNAYADEILFRAGVYPFRKRTRLSDAEMARIYAAMRETLSAAITILRERVGDDIHVEIRDFLAVHGKGGEPCPRCGTAVSEIKARQRLTNFCRTCQPGTLVRQ